MTAVGTELEQAAQLQLPGALQGMLDADRLTSTALIIDDPNISYEDFARILADVADFRRALKRLGDMTLFWVGDLMRTGESLFGDGAYQAFEALDASPGAMQDWLRVARLVPPDERRKELTWTHHRVVAARPEDRITLLDHAVEQSLSANALREYIRDLDQQVAAGAKDLSDDDSDSRIDPAKGVVVELVVDAATLCYHQAQRTPEGDAVVPAEPWAQLAAALGEE